jgi:hypothetical protein
MDTATQPAAQPEIDVVYTREEYREYADAEARKMLGVSFDEALEQLERGELQGTLAEVRLKLIRSLL